MTESELKPLLALLRALPSKQTWEPAHVQVYGMVLGPFPYDVGKAAVSNAVSREEWRPAPARVRRIVASLLSPTPGEEATYAEICYKAESVGLYGRQTGRNWYEEGAPPMSHPVVAQTVAFCGGWRAICSGEAQMQEGLRKQVRSGLGSAASDWAERVLAQLNLPAASRDREVCGPEDLTRYRRYAPYELPRGYVPATYDPGEPLMLEAAWDLERDAAVAMPADVRRRLLAAGMERVGRRLPARDEPECLRLEREAGRRQELRQQAAILAARDEG